MIARSHVTTQIQFAVWTKSCSTSPNDDIQLLPYFACEVCKLPLIVNTSVKVSNENISTQEVITSTSLIVRIFET